MLTIRQEHMSYKTTLYLINQDRDISGQCRIEFEDGNVQLPVRIAMMHLPFWEIYRRMHIPVYTHHIFFTQPPFNEKLYNSIMQQIYNECFREEEDNEYFKKLVDSLWETINNFDDFGTEELLEYVCGLSIIDLSIIHQDPKIQEILNIDIHEDLGPMAIKKNIIKGQDELIKAVSDEHFLEENALYPFTSVNAIKSSQLFQVLGNYGLRTEVNDRVFRRPVYGNAISGLQDFADMVLENSASRKNVYYSHDAIRLSQYVNREMALICMIFERLYPGWCGHEVTLPFYLDEAYASRCLWKHFYLPDDPTRLRRVLTEKNLDQYIGQTINMYSALTCGHTDGICERCLGLVSRNFTKGINVGSTSSSNAISEASQLVLSTKHEDQAIPTVYSIPAEAIDWFRVDKTGIVFRPEVVSNFKHLELGLFFSDIHCATGDLAYIDIAMDVPENKYSQITTLLIKNTDTGEVVEFVMEKEGMTPFLTTEFLLYIRDHIQNGVKMEENILWIQLEHLKDNPVAVLRSIVYNNSMMAYVTHITELFKKKHLSRYTNASKALQDFARIIFERVQNMNIFQLEIMIRAHTVTSSRNYSVPVIEDPANVRFAIMKDVIANRTISSQLAHEGHNAHFVNPFTYTTLKDENVMDPFVGI